jgi:hypothetical protein
LNAAIGIELDHHAGHLIHDPDIVLRIDADLLRNHEPVRVLADLADELSSLVELQQPRASVSERPGGADGDGGMARACVNENIALGIYSHTSDFTQMNIVWKLERLCSIEGNLRH